MNPSISPEQFTAVVQLKVTGTGPAGNVTGGLETFHLRQDDDMMEGFPLYLMHPAKAAQRYPTSMAMAKWRLF